MLLTSYAAVHKIIAEFIAQYLYAKALLRWMTLCLCYDQLGTILTEIPMITLKFYILHSYIKFFHLSTAISNRRNDIANNRITKLTGITLNSNNAPDPRKSCKTDSITHKCNCLIKPTSAQNIR